MVQRFGSREICDVTFKALNKMTLPNGKVALPGQPIFVIDTAQTSSMEQASTVVYAQGGRGYNRLIAWEGEKTMTFNVTDALMSPMGLSMLTNAGIVDATEQKPIHVHVTVDSLVTNATGKAEVTLETLVEELGLPAGTSEVYVCNDTAVKPYATVLDHNGGIADWMNIVTVSSDTAANVDSTNLVVKVEKNKPAVFTVSNKIDPTDTSETATYPAKNDTVKLDFYVVTYDGATQITIHPNDFGGTFYVEADTLYRNEDGKDMAATLTFPKVKINSAFTISMAANGDPSTFDFQMDAMPGYTYFDKLHKVVCDITVVGGSESESNLFHSENDHVGE